MEETIINLDIIQPEEENIITTPSKVIKPRVPHYKLKGNKQNVSEKENIKLDILKIRKEREILMYDSLLLDNKRKKLELIEFKLRLKKEYNYSDKSDSD